MTALRILLAAASLLLLRPGAFGADEIIVNLPSGGVVVFVLPAQGESLKALSLESLIAVRHTFEECGRLLPVEENNLKWAMERSRKAPPEELFRQTAKTLNADAYCVIAVAQELNTYYAELAFVPLNPAYGSQARSVRVKSRLIQNIPLKLSRALAKAHEKIPIHAPVLEKLEGDRVLIGAGQWHGIKPGAYRTASHGEVLVTVTSRYQSIARVTGQVPDEDVLVIKAYPETAEMGQDLTRRISENTVRKYSLESTTLRGDDAGKRYIEGMCVVNLGGNICLPVYGAFLSTQYLGFSTASPDMTGMTLSGAALVTQLALPEFMTGFRGNFFPWNSDADKSAAVHRMQTFLWVGLPFTFTVAYLDQLSEMFPKTDTLPPFFEERDTTAALMSLFVPGGGHFYKGRRLPGWGFYFTEMAVASYCAYEYRNRARAVYAFSALGVIKIADIALAYLSRTSYKHYTIETDRDEAAPSLSLQGRMNDREPVYELSLGFRF
ncbi:MAG: hypothetical protein EPN93_08355 [Spirochaetes bacterium]|nr:MAG: hypothetical protein EPN93_08355 [Spirochaetota bacterium]